MTTPRRRWWVEAAVVAAFYLAYGRVRALVEGSGREAMHNALDVIALQRAAHLFVERGVQHAIVRTATIARAADVYYGLVHFVVPGVALVYLWRRFPERYRTWRNAFAWMLLLALVGFWLYPLTPPRLLPGHYHFVDTAARYGGWGPIGASEGSGAANLYAAMPSLHLGWSTWSTFALVPVIERAWVRALLVVYPLLTLLVVVITANHYLLDGVAGVAVMGMGRGMVAIVDRVRRRLR